MINSKTIVLFDNKIYSTNPEDPQMQFIGTDIEYYSLFAKSDENLINITTLKKSQKNIENENKFLFYDSVATKARFISRIYDSFQIKSDYDLDCIKKVIVDDKYPVEVYFERQFKRLSPQRKTALMLGEYSILFGRKLLVESLELSRYNKAIPQLCEIILYDNDKRMVAAAISAISAMLPSDILYCLKKLLREVKDYKTLYMILSLIERFPFEQIIPELLGVFIENYYYHPLRLNDIDRGITIQQELLRQCSKIPSVAVLNLFELGIEHSYTHVEVTAFKSLQDWINLMLEKNSINDRAKTKILEIVHKYDFSVFKACYDQLKKR